MKIGYARVSMEVRNLDLQLDALRAEGRGQVFQSTALGSSSNRKRPAVALDAWAAGDVRPVWKLDWLAQSLNDPRILSNRFDSFPQAVAAVCG